MPPCNNYVLTNVLIAQIYQTVGHYETDGPLLTGQMELMECISRLSAAGGRVVPAW